MEAGPLILVVDDDRAIRDLLAEYLQDHGMRTATASNGAGMLTSLASDAVDLVVLDISMPGDDGLILCRNLRATSSLPVIFLTARHEAVDRIVGLEMGADDYISKPFEPRELLARIRNVLRRRNGPDEPLEHVSGRVVRFAGWRLDFERRHLTDDSGKAVALSGAEYRLLKAFTDQPGRVLSREQLATASAGRDVTITDRAVDLQISRLRTKLADSARAPDLIKTVRGEGYVLAAPVEREA